MRLFPIAILCLAFDHACASGHAVKSRELVHPYPPTGPVEVAGTPAAGKTLRAMQRYAVPAFTDVLAMHVAQTLQGASDRPVVVTRRPRQSGNDAAATVSSAVPDGRTLLLASAIPASSAAGSAPNLSAAAGLQPVALVASMPFVFIAGSASRHAELRDLVREARRGPAVLLVGSAGERSAGHLAIELLRLRHRLPIEPVAYNGGIAALHAVATKQVSTAVVPLPAVLPYLGAGHVRILAIAEPRRHPGIPLVPTAAEAGMAEVEATGRFGVFAPAATPRSVIRDLNAALARGPGSDETRLIFWELGLRLEHRAADDHSALRPAALIIGNHLSISALWWANSTSGVC